MKTILPFFVRYTPIQKLALINFEKKPDEIYCGLELQYLSGSRYGTGYRIIAYRNDGYVDMYDDNALTFDPNEKCDVAGKGLHKHIRTSLDGVRFEKAGYKVMLDFEFTDIEGRSICVHIHEQTKRRSTPMNLLAPIGVGSENPPYLPAFFLYDFDFVRKNRTKVDIKIDGNKIKPDSFPYPVPMNGQFRYYTRYSMNSLIFEFLPTDLHAAEVELNENLQYISDNILYQFKSNGSHVGLAEIELLGERKLFVKFAPEITLESCEGRFTITPDGSMGTIAGEYSVARSGDEITVKLIPNEGWKGIPNSFITKILMSPDSVFCSWCKKYEYTCSINLSNLSSKSEWKNGNLTQNPAPAGR